MRNEGWEIVAWSDVISIYNGRNQKAVQDINGIYPICGSGGIMAYANDYICPENTVIIGRKGNINKPILMREKFWNVDTAFGLVPNRDKLDASFLYYFCCNYNFEKHNKAVTIPSLTKADLLKITIPVPPLPIQEQIVAELDVLNDILSKKREQLAQLNSLAQATFYDMFGDPVENEKGWEVMYWEDIFITRTGKLNANAMNENGIYPFFTCSKQAFSINEYAFDCEALILAGNNATANYDVKHYKGKFNAYQRTYILNLLDERNSYLYFKFLLESKLEVMQQQSLGINTKYLTLSILKALSFILPPLALQNQFSEQIEAIERQKELINQSITEVQKLFDYTMDKYFN